MKDGCYAALDVLAFIAILGLDNGALQLRAVDHRVVIKEYTQKAVLGFLILVPLV